MLTKASVIRTILTGGENGCKRRIFSGNSFQAQEIEGRIGQAKLALQDVEQKLSDLQNGCTHPNKGFQVEYDFTAHWCPDCGARWSTK
jgi:hypothetical protein